MNGGILKNLVIPIVSVIFCGLIAYGGAERSIVGDILYLKNSTLPSTCTNGQMRYDSSVSSFKHCKSNVWEVVGSGSAGAITVESETASFTASTGRMYLVDTALGDVTATLPASATDTGSSISFYLSNATNSLIIDGNASETINGFTTVEMNAAGNFITILFDGSNAIALNYGVFEFEEVEITSTTTTTLADTVTDVTGSSLSLTKGTWEACYSVLGEVNDNSGATNFVQMNVRITDSSNVVVDKSISALEHGNIASNGNHRSTLSKCANVIVSADTTYKLRVSCNEAAADGECKVHNNDSTGSLANDDNHSMFWARRVAL